MTATTVVSALLPEHFETLYREAAGDVSRIPWADGHPNPALVNWLNASAPSLVRCGARTAVVGCGLGDDARELIRRGFEVTAFDCSETAVNWARRLDPANAHCYHTADLFDLPARWRARFDLVIEIYTIQALEPERHEAVAAAIAGLVGSRGHLLVICRGCEQPAPIDQGPPWPLTQDELLHITAKAGLIPAEPLSSFTDDETPPQRRIRGVFHRL